MNYRVYGEKVVDFSIIGDELYFNGVSYLVNNSTYRINLKTGGLVEKINDYSAKEICSDGTYIYYIEENAAGAATAIHKANMDGTNDEIVYDKGVSNLRVKNNKLYFIDSNNIHILNLQTKADTEIDVHTTTFDMDDNYISRILPIQPKLLNTKQQKNKKTNSIIKKKKSLLLFKKY